MAMWRSRLTGGPYKALFVVAVLAYLLGVITSPAFPTTRSVIYTEKDVVEPEPITPPEETLVQRKSTEECDCEGREQPPPGHAMLPKDLITFNAVCKKEPMAGEKARKVVIDELFDGVSPYERFPPKGVEELLEHERVKGWGSEMTVFRRLMEEVRPRVMIELGSFLGASATHMGSVANQLGLDTDIFCFDDFRGWPGFRHGDLSGIQQQNGNVMLMNQFMQNVVYRNMTESILPVPFGTIASLTWFCKLGIYADLIEVDASHDFHSAWADINIAYRLLRPGGVMFGHDYFTAADKRGVRRAVDMFARMHDLRVEPDGQHWIYRSKDSAI